MIHGDWANMCQAVWRSPLLPLLSSEKTYEQSVIGDIGSGRRFKRDFLAYLDAYGRKKTGSLIEQLKKYDFDGIRAALIASVPSRQEFPKLDSQREAIWGWPAVRDVLSQIPIHKRSLPQSKPPRVVIQVSSIASLGQTDKWLKDTFFTALCPPSPAGKPARFSIIFPTPDEIRRSLNGYASGGSIHMKLQSSAQQKQLAYMRPYLCHWAGDCDTNPSPALANSISNTVPHHSTRGQAPPPRNTHVREAGRRRAAPHIKTYIRFSDAEDMRTIHWAMVTSANLSTQAWGAATNAKQEVRICSWEIGVLVWPDLFVSQPDSIASGNGKAKEYAEMVPCFRRDTPCVSEVERREMEEESSRRDDDNGKELSTLVGFRMPYDLPLKPYSLRDIPWCATATHTEPDWLGHTWEDE
ncbi:hypothetical protein PRK78_005227 [Emydomyces testavorans]|uniref:Tyrosyl-DNA phosphodiesterase 1 n=1 Tax=Emydomyces testavorans TaxID=2070801 RepID=A0AAF0DJD7_9EURO|nr:hypothetical protein PRK78_005227 [Emydomyces testavorans]